MTRQGLKHLLWFELACLCFWAVLGLLIWLS